MTKNAFPYYEDAIAETGASLAKADGSYAEAKLYNMLRDQLPANWSFIWGTQLGAHEYDFLVLVPGQGIVNLECKGYGYRFIGATYTFNFHNKQTNKDEPRDLLGQAAGAGKYYISYLRDVLFGAGVHWGLMGYAVVFPLEEYAGIKLTGVPLYRASDCQSSGIGLPTIIQNALDAARAKLLEIGVQHPALLSLASAERVWKFWTQEENLEVHQFPYCRADLSSFRQSMNQVLTVTQYNIMNPLLNPNLKSVLVEGAAGSGKTFLAVTAAMKIEGNVLLVCFNKVLSRYLELTLPEKQGLEISHFHGLSESLMPGYKKPFKDVHETESSYFDRLDKETLEAARQLSPGTYKKYDAIIVDEAQDLTETQLRFLNRFRNSAGTMGGKLILFSSREQQLYPNRLTEKALKALLPDLVALQPLMLNLRNPKPVSEHCDQILGTTTPAVLEGPLVSHVQMPISGVTEFLSRLLCQYNPRDIAVLSPEHRYLEAVCMTSGTSFFGPNDSSLAKTLKNLRAWKENKCAWKSTTYAFKGLEAMVIVHLIPSGFSKHDILYVGASRATYQLFVCEIVDE